MGICSSEDAPPNLNEVDESHFEMLKVVGKGGFGKHRQTGDVLAMKRMRKAYLIRREEFVTALFVERDVMAHAEGGDLAWYLQNHERMPEHMACFYAAETLLGLDSLRKRKIVYRDMKPQNLLLDSLGHVAISDFGLACFLQPTSSPPYTETQTCGTYGYMAPEVKAHIPYNNCADVWSWGAVLYEFLHHYTPFGDREIITKQEDINRKLRFTDGTSNEVQDLFLRIFVTDLDKRIGCGPTGFEEIMNHPFFRAIDWMRLASKEYDPPYHPDPNIANCSSAHELTEQFFSKDEDEFFPDLSPEEQFFFKGIDFNNILDGHGNPLPPNQAPSDFSTYKTRHRISQTGMRPLGDN